MLRSLLVATSLLLVAVRAYQDRWQPGVPVSGAGRTGLRLHGSSKIDFDLDDPQLDHFVRMSSFTFETWLWTRPPGKDLRAVVSRYPENSQNNGECDFALLLTQSNSLLFFMGRSPERSDLGVLAYPGYVPPETWVHLSIALHMNGAMSQPLYVQIAVDDLVTRLHWRGPAESSRNALVGRPVTLGYYDNHDQFYFHGMFDETRFWRGALSIDDVRRYRHAPVSSKRQQALIAYFDYNHPQGTRIVNADADASSTLAQHHGDIAHVPNRKLGGGGDKTHEYVESGVKVHVYLRPLLARAQTMNGKRFVEVPLVHRLTWDAKKHVVQVRIESLPAVGSLYMVGVVGATTTKTEFADLDHLPYLLDGNVVQVRYEIETRPTTGTVTSAFTFFTYRLVVNGVPEHEPTQVFLYIDNPHIDQDPCSQDPNCKFASFIDV